MFKIMKFKSFIIFIKGFLPKLQKEASETKDMFQYLFFKKGDKVAAVKQLKDLGKSFIIFSIFMIPFVGGIFSGFILKRFPDLRPDSFQ
jgi:hypothetical protein